MKTFIIAALIAVNIVINIYNNLKIKKMATTLDDVLAAVAKQKTVDDSIVALLTSVEGQLKDALSSVTLPPDAQAKIDTIFKEINDNTQEVADAVTANTPAAPPTPTENPTPVTGGDQAAPLS